MQRQAVRALAVVAVSVVCGGFATSHAVADVSQLATLTPPTAGSTFPELLASSENFVAVGQQLPSGAGGVAVFASDAQGGWSSGAPAATLIDPANADSAVLPSVVVASGDVIVVGAVGADDYADSLLVYVRPPGGWSGAVAPSATLKASTGAYFEGVSISGGVVAAGGSDGSTYVFQQPSAGWTGTLTESARLSDPGVALQPEPVVRGRSVYVSHEVPLGEYVVFAEPADGWAGVVSPDGSLLTSGGAYPRPEALAFSGSLGLAPNDNGQELEMFNASAAQTTGRPAPVAYLHRSPPIQPFDLLFSSQLSVALYEAPGVHGPGSASVAAVSKPTAGWHGDLYFGRPFVRRSGACCTSPITAIAVTGRTVFVEGASGTTTVYRVSGGEGHQAPLPRLTFANISGLSAGRPQITIDLAHTPQLQSERITVPHGITIRRSEKVLHQSITGTGLPRPRARLHIAVRHHTLSLSDPPTGLTAHTLVITATALEVSPSLRAAIQHHHHTTRLVLGLTLREDDGITQHISRPLKITN